MSMPGGCEPAQEPIARGLLGISMELPWMTTAARVRKSRCPPAEAQVVDKLSLTCEVNQALRGLLKSRLGEGHVFPAQDDVKLVGLSYRPWTRPTVGIGGR